MVNKSERKMEYTVIVVGRVGTWVEIQNVLLGVRPVGNVKEKSDHFASVCKAILKN